MTRSQLPPGPPTSVLFVCLGNICRSPLAEGVFLTLLAEEGLTDRFRVDSAGTGSWHIGDPPDSRSVAVARDNGVDLVGRARQAVARDLRDFEWVIAMDGSNSRALERLRDQGATARIRRLLEFDPQGDELDVPDPYYGGEDGFQVVFAMVERSCRALLDHILGGLPLPGPPGVETER